MTVTQVLSKRASLVGAFFVLACSHHPASASSCLPPGNTEPAQIRYIHDGDTLVLADNRKVRLIGINTPELAHSDRPAQALSIDARDRLRQLLFEQGNKAQILFGAQKVDDYGRTLAHIWSPDGRNFASELLREGLGWTIAIPPNTLLLDCYVDSERQARAASRGVWAHPGYAATPSHRVSLRDGGFTRVKGRVIRVHRGGGATWINLAGRFAARIPDQNLQWFTDPPGKAWVGREVEVRGWMYSSKGESRITVHHPASITVASEP